MFVDNELFARQNNFSMKVVNKTLKLLLVNYQSSDFNRDLTSGSCSIDASGKINSQHTGNTMGIN